MPRLFPNDSLALQTSFRIALLVVVAVAMGQSCCAADVGGFAYDGSDIEGIEEIVAAVSKPSEAWRVAADKRIIKHRTADIAVRIVDQQGESISGAKVRVKLLRHEFAFGGVINAKQFSGVDSKFGGTPELYKKTFLAFFNKAGFNNALKYRLRRGFEDLVPPILKWFQKYDIPVRGHTLIWPGWKHTHDDAKELADRNDLEGLRQFCENQIVEYAKKWDVVEWDVINEPRGNQDIQDLLGKEVMVDWFKIAKQNVRNPDAKLYLNEFGVVSAPLPGREKNLKIYEDTVRYLLEKGAPLSGLGFQSRFKSDLSAEKLYRRLQLFEQFKLPIAATEFEIKERDEFQPDEKKRAEITERAMTVFFSHPSVVTIMAWTVFASEEDSRGVINQDGSLKLNGKVWLYMTKKRWHTDKTAVTDANGLVRFRGFKGRYAIKAEHEDRSKTGKFILTSTGREIQTEL